MRTVASASGTFTVWSEAHNKDTGLMGCRATLFSIMLHCTARHCTTAHCSTTKLQLTLHDAPLLQRLTLRHNAATLNERKHDSDSPLS